MRDENGINIEQYLGVWAMHQPLLLEFADHVRTMDLAAHMAAAQATRTSEQEPAAPRQYEMFEGGIAMVDLVGTMTKYGSSFSQMRRGTVGVRRALRSAAADDSVKAIVLRIDSPGGNFAGTSDLADDVYAARQKKTITAYIEDLGASAAYFVASQASQVVASPGAIVGSIGVYGVVADYSGMAAREGIKVHVIRAGQFKGVGVSGTEITPEQLAELQRTVNDVNGVFTAAVARGRKMTAERVAELADGRVHVAADAQKLGLIDAVQTLDRAIESLRNTGKGRSSSGLKQRSKNMTTENDTATPAAPVAATLSELKSSFPGSTAEWREQCMEQGLTMTQAQTAWGKHLEAQLAAANKAVAEQTARAEKAEAAVATRKTTVGPLTTGKAAAEEGNARAEWLRLLEAKTSRGMSRQQACLAVDREHPGLREQMLAETRVAV